MSSPVRRLGMIGLVVALLVAACAPRDAAAPQTVILVSLDGWRWDYLDRVDAPHLRSLATAGVWSEALLPSFPSLTFPNHYTLVTGLHPDRHGIVSNTMDDELIGERFTMSAATAKDPRWWGGEPVWVTARKHGLRSASMFWPGSEVPMAGGQPDDWMPFDGDFANRDRIRRVLEWLDRPESTRPAFITLYFSDTDGAGHDAGPESPELAEAAKRVDDAIGTLVAGVNARGLTNRVTFVFVSDHGMSAQSHDRQVVIDDYLDPARLAIIDMGPVLSAFPATGEDPAALVAALSGKHPSMRVYLKEDLPPELHYGDHPRVPPILALADDGWSITTRARLRPSTSAAGGRHGYPSSATSMHGLFVAAGAPLRSGLRAGPIRSVDVYEFICRLLDVAPAPNDGDPAATADFFR